MLLIVVETLETILLLHDQYFLNLFLSSQNRKQNIAGNFQITHVLHCLLLHTYLLLLGEWNVKVCESLVRMGGFLFFFS